jgi:NADPH2:quinone reductase
MRALRVVRNGRPSEVLAVEELERPEPGPGSVRVRVSAASLNWNDLDRCYGRVTTIPNPPPFTLGMDVCGVVDAAGDGAQEWLGRRVVAITQLARGGLAEWAIAPVTSVFEAPPELDDAEGAAFVIPYHTIHLALYERGGLRAGETVLVHAGASGLGTAAIQLARAKGARVFTTSGGATKTRLCAELGAELAIDHRERPFAEAVLDHTQDVGADVVCDLVGGGFVADSWRCIARGGRYLVVGFADDPKSGTGGHPLRQACMGNFSIVGVIGAYVPPLPPAIRRTGFNPFGRDVALAVHADLLQLVAKGAIRPVIGRRIALEEVGPALEDHAERRTHGRTVVEIQNSAGASTR